VTNVAISTIRKKDGNRTVHQSPCVMRVRVFIGTKALKGFPLA
jgi:hypothetical protein